MSNEYITADQAIGVGPEHFSKGNQPEEELRELHRRTLEEVLDKGSVVAQDIERSGKTVKRLQLYAFPSSLWLSLEDPDIDHWKRSTTQQAILRHGVQIIEHSPSFMDLSVWRGYNMSKKSAVMRSRGVVQHLMRPRVDQLKNTVRVGWHMDSEMDERLEYLGQLLEISKGSMATQAIVASFSTSATLPPGLRSLCVAEWGLTESWIEARSLMEQNAEATSEEFIKYEG